MIARVPVARILVVGGSDSGGGAGIQADLKTVMALGGYATTAITALTAQDTRGVHAVHPVPPEFVARQMALALDDIGADAVKSGMLGDAAIIHAVAGVLQGRGLPLVLDPVMVAKGGSPLLDPAATEVLWLLIRMATVLTPNVPEAEALLGHPIPKHEAALEAAAALLRRGAPAVLLKGGHLPGPIVQDILATPAGITVLQSPRIDTRHTHGTGCTLASAVATGLAQGLPLPQAVDRARRYVHAAIAAAPGLGTGHGPLNHAVTGVP